MNFPGSLILTASSRDLTSFFVNSVAWTLKFCQLVFSAWWIKNIFQRLIRSQDFYDWILFMCTEHRTMLSTISRNSAFGLSYVSLRRELVKVRLIVSRNVQRCCAHRTSEINLADVLRVRFFASWLIQVALLAQSCGIFLVETNFPNSGLNDSDLNLLFCLLIVSIWSVIIRVFVTCFCAKRDFRLFAKLIKCRIFVMLRFVRTLSCLKRVFDKRKILIICTFC